MQATRLVSQASAVTVLTGPTKLDLHRPSIVTLES